MYLTFDEYQEFGGTLTDETAFTDLEFEARTIIDWWTYNRLQDEVEYPEAVKRCVFKLISIIKMKQDAQTLTGQEGVLNRAGIINQSNDGVSTTYNVMTATEALDTVNAEIAHTIRKYLQGVRNSLGRKVLYRGLYPGE